MRIRSLHLTYLLLLAVAAASCAGEAPSEAPSDEPAPVVEAPGEVEDTPSADPAEQPEEQDSDEDLPAEEADPAEAAPVEPDLGVPVVLTDVVRMDSPVAGAAGPGGMLFLAERGGTVHTLTSDGLGSPVIDVSGETTTDGERGLLGIAFAADMTELYASFTDRNGDNVLAAYSIDASGVIDSDSQRVILTVDQPFSNHNGGDVQIGPDGLLYWGLGDGGQGGDPLESGQDTSTLLGSLLRIDPRGGEPYGVPADNPFVDQSEGADEIWAYGLRNPWRFSFDASSEQLWIADVGQSDREEINRIPANLAGANFGWNLMEGTLEFAGEEPEDHVPPIHEYETGSRCSITGGYVYRGSAIPELTGAYLFSDYCDGDVRAILVDDDGNVTDEANLGVNGGNVVSFAQDADGELYVLDLSGRVSRLDPAG